MCCDISEEWTAIAREHWALAGVDDRIDLRIGPALDTLVELGGNDQFDLVFIDADKPSYSNYLDAVLPHLRPGGIVLVDNTLWSGRVAATPAADDDENTTSLRAFNGAVAERDDVQVVVLPIGDGVTVIQRR